MNRERTIYCVKVLFDGTSLKRVTQKLCEMGIPYFVKDDLTRLDESAGYKVMAQMTKEEAEAIKVLVGVFMIIPEV